MVEAQRKKNRVSFWGGAEPVAYKSKRIYEVATEFSFALKKFFCYNRGGGVDYGKFIAAT